MVKSACGNYAEVPLSGVRPNSALLISLPGVLCPQEAEYRGFLDYRQRRSICCTMKLLPDPEL